MTDIRIESSGDTSFADSFPQVYGVCAQLPTRTICLAVFSNLEHAKAAVRAFPDAGLFLKEWPLVDRALSRAELAEL